KSVRGRRMSSSSVRVRGRATRPPTLRRQPSGTMGTSGAMWYDGNDPARGTAPSPGWRAQRPASSAAWKRSFQLVIAPRRPDFGSRRWQAARPARAMAPPRNLRREMAPSFMGLASGEHFPERARVKEDHDHVRHGEHQKEGQADEMDQPRAVV